MPRVWMRQLSLMLTLRVMHRLAEGLVALRRVSGEVAALPGGVARLAEQDSLHFSSRLTGILSEWMVRREAAVHIFTPRPAFSANGSSGGKLMFTFSLLDPLHL